jgi:hypothetical protein
MWISVNFLYIKGQWSEVYGLSTTKKGIPILLCTEVPGLVIGLQGSPQHFPAW